MSRISSIESILINQQAGKTAKITRYDRIADHPSIEKVQNEKKQVGTNTQLRWNHVPIRSINDEAPLAKGSYLEMLDII